MVEFQRNATSTMLGAAGLDQLQLEEALDEITVDNLKEQTSGVGAVMLSLLASCFIGLIVSLIISAIMKKNPTP